MSVCGYMCVYLIDFVFLENSDGYTISIEEVDFW